MSLCLSSLASFAEVWEIVGHRWVAGTDHCSASVVYMYWSECMDGTEPNDKNV